MQTFKKALFILGWVVFAVVGLLLSYSAYLWSRRWTAMEKPVRIEAGYTLAESFTVGVAEDYQVAVVCQRKIPFEKLNSLLMHDLATTFSVRTGGMLLASGRSADQPGASWGKDISRTVGLFRAVPGRTYQLTLRFDRTLPDLAATGPVVKVEVVTFHRSDAAVAGAIFFCLALALGLVGWACILPHGWTIWVRAGQANRGHPVVDDG